MLSTWVWGGRAQTPALPRLHQCGAPLPSVAPTAGAEGERRGDQALLIRFTAGSAFLKGTSSRGECLLNQLAMVITVPILVTVGDGESGFDSREGA